MIQGPNNQNKKKREKRKAKKDAEKIEKEEAEKAQKERENQKALEKYKKDVMDGKSDAKIKGPDGKVLKKKILSGKSKVVDDIGDEWE